MNNDFPRILTLLRKERKLSQKQAAADLGVAQALLSHYEKGKRECGLEFLVRAADYYSVSTDYLLGRSALSDGKRITESDLPDAELTEKATTDPSSLTTLLSKKLIVNSIELIFSLLVKMKSASLTKALTSYLNLAVYKAFRLLYEANPHNDSNMFSVKSKMSHNLVNAAMSIAEGEAELAGEEAVLDEAPTITTAMLEESFNMQAPALLNVVKNCETRLKKLGE